MVSLSRKTLPEQTGASDQCLQESLRRQRQHMQTALNRHLVFTFEFFFSSFLDMVLLFNYFKRALKVCFSHFGILVQ